MDICLGYNRLVTAFPIYPTPHLQESFATLVGSPSLVITYSKFVGAQYP